MILYIKSLNSPHKKTVITNIFSKVSGYGINIQKFLMILYSNNKIPQREVKNIIPFKVA